MAEKKSVLITDVTSKDIHDFVNVFGKSISSPFRRVDFLKSNSKIRNKSYILESPKNKRINITCQNYGAYREGDECCNMANASNSTISHLKCGIPLR